MTAPKLKFEIAEQENFTEIRLLGPQTPEAARELLSQIPQMIEDRPTDYVVYCETLNDCSGPWTRTLMTLHQKLKSIDKQVRLIGASENLQRSLKKEGVDSSLKISSTLKAALVDFGLMKEKVLDVNFINPFLTATIKVLQTQSSTEAKAGQIYTKGAREKFLGDISGVIGLVSEAFTGSVVITFPEKTFLGVMSRMLDEEFTEISKEIEDGAGEITNIIFGQAKIVLNERGYGIKTALPSVVTGQQHSILQMSNGPRMVIPFETDLGPFFVEICTSG